MSTVVKVDGRDFTVKLWTVKQKKAILKPITERAKVDPNVPRDLEKEYDEVVQYVKENTLTGLKEDIQEEVAVTVERLWSAIIQVNSSLPLVLETTSGGSSTSVQTQRQTTPERS